MGVVPGGQKTVPAVSTRFIRPPDKRDRDAGHYLPRSRDVCKSRRMDPSPILIAIGVGLMCLAGLIVLIREVSRPEEPEDEDEFASRQW